MSSVRRYPFKQPTLSSLASMDDGTELAAIHNVADIGSDGGSALSSQDTLRQNKAGTLTSDSCIDASSNSATQTQCYESDEN